MVLYAKDIVEKDFISVSSETSAFEGARLMKERRQGFLLILSEEGTPNGVVTEWDYLSKIVAEGRDASKTKLGEIMTTGLITANASDSLEEIARKMSEKQVRRLLIISDGKTIGVITTRTILARLDEYVNKLSTTIARLQTPPIS